VPEVGEGQLLGGDAVGQARGHDRARRGADVEVEVVDGGALAHRVHGVEHAEVVGGAADASAAED
jgi:hypothetical protein